MRIASCPLDGRSGHDAGRALLEKLYLQETGQPMPPVLVDQWGYPYFENTPYYFSISHTQRYAFCALAKHRVGLDAEELGRRVHLRLAERILSPGELQQFRQAANKEHALLTFWVLKEAAAKLSGLGLRGFPNGTNFRLDDPRVRQWHNCLVAVVQEEGVHEDVV